jgi:hypothetical protein
MKITFVHISMLCILLFVSLAIGYLADALFDKRWYGYLAVGAALSCFLYFNNPKMPAILQAMHPYLRYSIGFFVLLLIFSGLGFLGKVVFGLDFYKPVLFGFVMTFVMYNSRAKSKIKKQQL